MFAIALAWHGAGLLSLIAVCVQGEWGWHEPKPLGHVELMVFGGFSSTKKGSERALSELWFLEWVRNAVLVRRRTCFRLRPRALRVSDTALAGVGRGARRVGTRCDGPTRSWPRRGRAQ